MAILIQKIKSKVFLISIIVYIHCGRKTSFQKQKFVRF